MTSTPKNSLAALFEGYSPRRLLLALFSGASRDLLRNERYWGRRRRRVLRKILACLG